MAQIEPSQKQKLMFCASIRDAFPTQAVSGAPNNELSKARFPLQVPLCRGTMLTASATTNLKAGLQNEMPLLRTCTWTCSGQSVQSPDSQLFCRQKWISVSISQCSYNTSPEFDGTVG
jgi:hypothetical protein